jgi:hypothetical protein
MLAGGGRTLGDLRALRGDDGLRSLLHLNEMPSSDATGDWLRRMGSKESGGLAGLQQVNRCVFRRLLRNDERSGYTIDIDATQIVACDACAALLYAILETGRAANYASAAMKEGIEGQLSAPTLIVWIGFVWRSLKIAAEWGPSLTRTSECREKQAARHGHAFGPIPRSDGARERCLLW